MSTVAPPFTLTHGDARWQMEAGGMSLSVLARAQDTGGQLTFLRYEVPPGFTGPPLHVHRDLDEAMLVLAGTFAVRLGDDEHEIGPGGFAWMPREVPHAFANVGDATGVWVGFVAPPGGMEAFFEAVDAELGEAGGPPDPARLMELNTRHGIEVLGPPIRSPAPG